MNSRPMTRESPMRAVAFDLMDTLLHDPWKAALRAAFGDRLEAAMSDRDPTSWPRFELGHIDEAGFWAAHAQHRPDIAASREVRLAETTWLPGMRTLVADVHAAGSRTAIASNYPSWFEDLESVMADVPFDEVVVSYRIGARKPDAAFYFAVAEALGTSADETVFVDDRPGNVEAAEAVGMTGILFTGADDLREALASLGVV